MNYIPLRLIDFNKKEVDVMKKILLLLLLLVILPISVNADLKVLSHYIDAEIEIAGGLNVQELIIVEGDGNFLQRTLNYYSFGSKHWKTGDEVELDNGIIYNGQDISLGKITAFEFDDDTVSFGEFDSKATEYFSEFDIKNVADKAYTFEDKEDGSADLKIFYQVKNKKVAFYINYVITNVVVKHNDIKEINYTFKNLDLKSNLTYLRVIIPYPTSNDQYKVWVHGNQSGKVEELITSSDDKAGIIAKFPKVEESINFRMTLPSEQVGIDMYLNNSEQDALDEIVKIEDEKLADTNKGKKIVNIMKYILLIMGALYVIGSFIFIKINNNIIYIIYLVLGLFIYLFNYIFKFNYWYLYIIILFPIIVKLIKKYIVK